MSGAEPGTATIFGIDDALIGHLRLSPADTLLELGCGSGRTLAAVAQRVPGIHVVGLDIDVPSLQEAEVVLARVGARFDLVQVDLTRPLPLAAASVDRILCHNVVEELPDPGALVAEASRVMRSGARSVWSHTDFDSVVVAGADRELTRRIVKAHADRPGIDARHFDPHAGRSLPGVVAASPLGRPEVHAHTMVRSELDGLAGIRITSMVASVRSAAPRLGLRGDELDAWTESLAAADAGGRFLYAQATFIAVAEKA